MSRQHWPSRVLPSAGQVKMASDSSSGTGNTDSNRITVDSVLEALENLKEVNGSSLSSLKKYFTSTSPVHIPANDVSSQIKKALAKGIRDGKIAKFGKSKFSLGLEDEHKSSKKHRRRGEEDEEGGATHRPRPNRKKTMRKRSKRRGSRRKRVSRKKRSGKKMSRKRRRSSRRGRKSKRKGRGRSRRRSARKARRGKSRKRR
ncbi:hypothetical protein PoB_007093000 [Plakobranchus ocellatus]|uniref:H15 domain-containing protein n=1 Tax=Plakobranchus ocellatus TaxID=259542 RepID=A0AAV4DJU6_9GAST|nr:hypothetical protein PoB_007093000 [Plakobranchus ocellatus]